MPGISVSLCEINIDNEYIQERIKLENGLEFQINLIWLHFNFLYIVSFRF